MKGAGSSWVEKKQHSTAAIIGAAAPAGQPVRIQNAQHSSTATTAAKADSSAIPRSWCRALAGTPGRWRSASGRRPCTPASMCWRSARVSTHRSTSMCRRAARFVSSMPLQPSSRCGAGASASMRACRAAPCAASETSFGVSVSAVTSCSSVLQRADTSAASSSRSAASRSSMAETTGTNCARRSCSALTAFSVQRRCEVSKGRWVLIRRSSVMSPESLRRSPALRGSPAGLSASRIQWWASRTAPSRRPSSTGAKLCGSTRLCISVAHVMPSTISSTRASAMSKMAPGSLTAGKPIRPAV